MDMDTAEYSKSRKKHLLTHYWFRNWPDNWILGNMDVFVDFIKVIYKEIKKDIFENKQNGNKNIPKTLIHCSAGTGRTGIVFIILTLMLKLKFNKKGKYTCPLGNYDGNKITIGIIVNEILKFRAHVRPGLVHNKYQFMFICNVFGINDNDIDANILKKLFPVFPVKDKHNKLLTKIPRYGGRKNIKLYSKKNNNDKNRHPMIIPYQDNYVRLQSGEYVNASIYKNFILSQCPIPYGEKSFDYFHRMIIELNVKRIIMVTELEKEDGKQLCDYYMNFTGYSSFEETPTEKNGHDAYEIRKYYL
jgi:protein tyrosine phosphatase